MPLAEAARPPEARWAAAYVALVVGALAVAAATPLLWQDALFLLGAAFVLLSVAFIRTGSPTGMMSLRDERGARIARVPVDPEVRRAEIRRGVAIFLGGLALWTPLFFDYVT